VRSGESDAAERTIGADVRNLWRDLRVKERAKNGMRRTVVREWMIDGFR
jgi:hypothetical protein